MLHIFHINYKSTRRRLLRHSGILALLALVASISISLVNPSPTLATSCDNSVSCISVEFGNPVGDRTVNPSSNIYSATQFYLPVAINIEHGAGYAIDYTIKVYGSGSSLTDSSNSIPSVLTNTSYNDLGKNGSEWGMRWHFGDTIEDAYADYRPVPASSNDDASVVVADGKIDQSTSSITKQLTLGFAVAVDGSQASGSYTNTVTVAVVASPKDARTIFDISTMQEMTGEICSRVATPRSSVTDQFDTTGEHVDDPNYIPETTLTDVRDGKTYLIRKLADGNCWMSQNLSLDLVAGQELNQRTTDLNSKRSWVPMNTTQPEVDAAWLANTGIDYSMSYGQDEYWDGGTGNSSFVIVSDATQAVGYAQRGIYYNWVAATAGSGKPSDTYNTTEGSRIINGTVQDSICPRGWMLPVGNTTSTNTTDGSVKSFYNLVQLYTNIIGNIDGANTNTLYKSPMNFVPAGYFYHTGKTPYNAGQRQLYWSGTATASAGKSFVLDFATSGTVYPGTNFYVASDVGFSIRCVAR